MKESDIRGTIAAVSATLERAVARSGQRGGPFAAGTLVVGAGLMAAACFEATAVYGVECIGDDCFPDGGHGGTTATGGQGGLGGGGGAGAEGGSQGGAGGVGGQGGALSGGGGQGGSGGT